MRALHEQYFHCYKYYTEYKDTYLVNDIRAWQTQYKCYFNFRTDDIRDIRSELKCLLLADVKKKYQACRPIYNPRNYVFTVCKNDLKNTLTKLARLRKNEKQFKYDWEIKMIDAKNRKNGNLLTTLDQYSYAEVRELFKSALNIREMAVVYLVHSGFSYTQIAKTLKVSEDYCRKLYSRAENKLKKALDLG